MYLGLDLGTSGLRAMLVDAHGVPLAVAERACTTQHPHPGWSEQDPAEWIAALEAAAGELRASHPAQWDTVRGIGVSGHMHGATLVDAAGAVIRPCILWNDTRSHAEAAALDATPGVRDLSGNIVFPGFTAPKLLWVERHEPDAFARIDKVLLPAAYLNFWLTGEAVADMSDSAGTAWLDVGARDWSDRLLEAGHMTRGQMPRLVEGSEPAGNLSARAAEALGLPRSAIVVGGAGDNAAAACGVGALSEGQAFVSLGTSGVLCAARAGFRPLAESAVHTFCHAVPGRWYQMGVILSATDSLNWLARITGQGAAQLSGLLPATIDGPGAVRFLPYLSGERTPHNDAAIRGAFTGLGQSDGPAELVQAVMEGVAFALADCHEALKATGARPERALAIGGGAASRFWLESIATVLDLPLDLPQAGEFGAALGAARLAICGVTGAAPAEVMTPPAVRDTVMPRAELSSAYAEAWGRYRESYTAIRAVQ